MNALRECILDAWLHSLLLLVAVFVSPGGNLRQPSSMSTCLCATHDRRGFEAMLCLNALDLLIMQ